MNNIIFDHVPNCVSKYTLLKKLYKIVLLISFGLGNEARAISFLGSEIGGKIFCLEVWCVNFDVRHSFMGNFSIAYSTYST